MKRFYQSLKRQDGFTLVELMVVVAIIGLLSAVAVPNFKKYQARSKISEAKLQLSALYTAQSAFFSDFNMYASCLRYMGYDPDKERANRYYAIGFAAGVSARADGAHEAAVNSGMLEDANTGCPKAGTVKDGTGNSDNDVTYFLAGKGVGAARVDGTSVAFTGNAATAAGTCTAEDATGGNCLGDQSDTDNMTFNAAAVGIISSDNITAATASGLTINNLKILRTLVNGY